MRPRGLQREIVAVAFPRGRHDHDAADLGQLHLEQQHVLRDGIRLLSVGGAAGRPRCGVSAPQRCTCESAMNMNAPFGRGGRYWPPVTSMVTPVTKSASLEARKQITRAWSTGSAMRRSGTRSTSAFCSIGDMPSQRGRSRGLRVRLGAIALTLMPCGPSSSDSLRVSAMIPPLAVA